MEAKLLHIPWMVSVLYSSTPFSGLRSTLFAGSWRQIQRSLFLDGKPA
jgi:hypothetical protein